MSIAEHGDADRSSPPHKRHTEEGIEERENKKTREGLRDEVRNAHTLSGHVILLRVI